MTLQRFLSMLSRPRYMGERLVAFALRTTGWDRRLAIARGRRPYPELVKLLQSYNGERPGPEVLIIGDSVFGRVSHDDRDRRDLGTMIRAELRPRTSLFMTHTAYHIGVVGGLYRVLRTMRHRPRAVVIGLNMRNFSPQWYLSPLIDYRREMEFLERFRQDPSIPIESFSHLEESEPFYREFEAKAVSFPGFDFKTIKDCRDVIRWEPANKAEREERYGRIFAYHYLYLLEASNPRLEDLRQTLAALRDDGIRVFIYLTPINVEAGRRLLGEVFSRRFAENRNAVSELIQSFVAPGICAFEDWSEFLGQDLFFHRNDPTEHIGQAGRLMLAKLVATGVDQLLSSDPSHVKQAAEHATRR